MVRTFVEKNIKEVWVSDNNKNLTKVRGKKVCIDIILGGGGAAGAQDGGGGGGEIIRKTLSFNKSFTLDFAVAGKTAPYAVGTKCNRGGGCTCYSGIFNAYARGGAYNNTSSSKGGNSGNGCLGSTGNRAGGGGGGAGGAAPTPSPCYGGNGGCGVYVPRLGRAGGGGGGNAGKCAGRNGAGCHGGGNGANCRGCDGTRGGGGGGGGYYSGFGGGCGGEGFIIVGVKDDGSYGLTPTEFRNKVKVDGAEGYSYSSDCGFTWTYRPSQDNTFYGKITVNL